MKKGRGERATVGQGGILPWIISVYSGLKNAGK
jgi:hypothetical protein